MMSEGNSTLVLSMTYSNPLKRIPLNAPNDIPTVLVCNDTLSPVLNDNAAKVPSFSEKPNSSPALQPGLNHSLENWDDPIIPSISISGTRLVLSRGRSVSKSVMLSNKDNATRRSPQ